ncbi:MAG: hypothetical protein EOP49_10345, partial [Sphingobacteriales bacterium]
TSPVRVPGFAISPLTYTWSPATGLSATTGNLVTASPTTTTVYTVTASDGTCSATATSTVTVNDLPQVSTSATDATCSSVADGTATATATAGTAPYTYLWSNGETTATATALPAGNNTVTVTDANGCSVQGTATIGIMPVASDPSVFGNGVWNVYAWNSGGSTDVGTSWNQNYSGYYTDSTLNLNTQSQWNSNGSPSDAAGFQGCPVGADNHSFSAKRTGFACGFYSIDIPTHDDEAELWINGVMVWEHNGCCDSHTNVWSGFLDTSSQVEFRVTEGGGGSNGSIQFSSQTASITGLQNICAGGTVALTAQPTGANFLWSNGATTQSTTVSAAGTYTVTISSPSVAGCSLTASHIVSAVIATASGTSICSGETASLTATGADTYSWYDASAGGNLLGTGATFTTPALIDTTTYYVEGLAGGINNLATTMAGGNGASGNMFDLTTQASAVSITSFDINTYNFGIPVTVEVYYKTGSYSGSQNTPANWTLHSSTTVNGLGFGNYTNIPIPALTLSANQTYGLYVTTTDGSISYTDGVNTYSDSYLTFASGNGNSYPFQSDFFPRTFNGRINYSVNNCAGPRQAVTVVVTEPATLSVTTTNTACNGAANGAATVTPTGTGPFTYSWNTSPAQTTATATGLAAGTYSVTVTDNNGCTSAATATITEPAVLATTISSQTNASCFGGSNGSATVTVTGGTGTYTYNWNTTPAQTTATATGLAAGDYTVTVTDANGCSATATATITQPASAVSGDVVVTNVSMIGGSNGAVNLTPSGGIPPYTYNWNDGITTQDRTGLPAGNYSVVITDANGCTGTVLAVITQPQQGVCAPDTIRYPYLKEQVLGTGSHFIDAMVGNVRTASQAYQLNSPVTITGVQFWGAAYSTSSSPQTLDVVAYLYSVDAANKPIAKIDSTIITITEQYDWYEASFATPQLYSQNFAVAIKSVPVDTLAVMTNDAGLIGSQNVGEGLAWRRFGSGVWNSSLAFFGQDLEYMIFPIVEYSVDAELTASTDTLCLGGTVNFGNTASPLLGNRFFNLNAFDYHFGLAAADSSLLINYGAGNGWSASTTGGHSYSSAGTYQAQLVWEMQGYFTSCSDTSTVQITVQNADFSASTLVTTPMSCFGSSNGTINLTPGGGTAPYTFNWGGGITTEDRTGLAAGTYTVT